MIVLISMHCLWWIQIIIVTKFDNFELFVKFLTCLLLTFICYVVNIKDVKRIMGKVS